MGASDLSGGLEPKLCKPSLPGLQALIASLSFSVTLKTKYDACTPALSANQNQPPSPGLLQSTSPSTPDNSPTSKLWSHPSPRPSNHLPAYSSPRADPWVPQAPDSSALDSAGHPGAGFSSAASLRQACPVPSAGKDGAPRGLAQLLQVGDWTPCSLHSLECTGYLGIHRIPQSRGSKLFLQMARE